MSMANLFVQREAAFLMTDSGYFHADGTISRLHPKSMVLADLPAALAVVGRGMHLGWIGEAMSGKSFTTVFDLLSQLPEIVRLAYQISGLDADDSPARLFVACYSHEVARSAGCILFTSASDGPPSLEPWKIYPVTSVMAPTVDESAVFAGVNILDPGAFNPRTDAMALIQAQRDARDGWSDWQGCGVAGEIDLTTVSKSGVTVTTLHRFPDRVGALAG